MKDGLSIKGVSLHAPISKIIYLGPPPTSSQGKEVNPVWVKSYMADLRPLYAFRKPDGEPAAWSTETSIEGLVRDSAPLCHVWQSPLSPGQVHRLLQLR